MHYWYCIYYSSTTVPGRLFISFSLNLSSSHHTERHLPSSSAIRGSDRSLITGTITYISVVGYLCACVWRGEERGEAAYIIAQKQRRDARAPPYNIPYYINICLVYYTVRLYNIVQVHTYNIYRVQYKIYNIINIPARNAF